MEVQVFLQQIEAWLLLGATAMGIGVGIYQKLQSMNFKKGFTAVVTAVESMDATEVKAKVKELIDDTEESTKYIETELQKVVAEFKKTKEM